MGLKDTLAATWSAYSYMFIVFFFGLIELIAAALNCQNRQYWYQAGQPYWNSCVDYNAWAVAVGAMTVGLIFIFFICCLWPVGGCAKAAPWLALFMVIIWIPGAFVTTFDAPFVAPANGYYAAWGAFFFSLMFMQQTGMALFGSCGGGGGGGGSSGGSSNAVAPGTTTTVTKTTVVTSKV